MSTQPTVQAGNWASPDAAFNISPKDADAFLSGLAVTHAIIAVQARIKPVSENPGWPAADPIVIEVRTNITANPNVGYGSLSPWFLNNEQVFEAVPLNLEVILLAQTEGLNSEWTNLAEWIANLKSNQSATLLTTFAGINLARYEQDLQQWATTNTQDLPQPLPPI